MRAFPRFAPLTVVALAIVLSGCGQNNLTPLVGPTATSTPTATVPHTATSTIPPAPTATAAPSFTSTRVPIPTLTATQTVTSPPTQSATATVSPTPAAAMLMFNADATNPQNPFPSDRLIGSDGHVHLPATYLQINAPRTPEFQLAFAYADLAASQLSELTGFGTFAPLRIRFDRPMTVDMGSNPRGVYVLEYNDLAGKPAVVTATAYDPDNSIEIQPVVPFKPKTTYALILTTDITDGNGNHIMPSPDFTKLLAGTDLSPDLAAWRSKLQPVIDFAANNLDINQQALALVDLFTTLPTTDDLVAIEHRLATGNLVPGMPVFDQPLGNLQTGIFPEGSAGYADLIGAPTSPNVSEVAIGYFESYDFRTGPKGGFDPAKVNGPTVPGTNKVDFYMTIPKAPKPPGGYPIVIFGHGLGGSGRDVARIADLGIDLPVVGIAISALQHGRRGTVTNFFVLNDIATTREYFRQTVADTLQEYRMIKEAHAAGIAPFDQIDPDHIEYLGGSLGGIMGTMLMAVSQEIQVGMLSVPGGGLPNIMVSHDIGMLLQPLLSFIVGIDPKSPYFAPFFHRFTQSSQWALEPADPINYGGHLIIPGEELADVPLKRILVHEGIIDSVVPNRTTDDLARVMRVPDLNLTRGCDDANGCSGIWRFVMTDYGKDELGGHTVTIDVPQATQQAFDFITSFGTHIPDASPP